MKLKSLVIAMSLMAASTAMASHATDATTGASTKAAETQLDVMNQVNDGTGLGNADWANMVQMHGGLNTDGHWGSTDQGFTGENDNRFSVTDAYLNLVATPNSWARLNIDMDYSDASSQYNPSESGELNIEQAYATFGDFDKYPLFLQIGRQYSPFGRFELHPVVKSMAQVLTETNQTEAQLGYIGDNGFYGSVFGFQNQVSKNEATSEAATNYGLAAGFQKSNDHMDVDLGLGYMNDMAGVDAVEAYLEDNGDVYNNTVHALNSYLRFHTGPFGFNVDYVTAMDNYDASIVPAKSGDTDGAQPWASGVEATYDFMMKEMNSQISFGYQKSDDASAIGLPEGRYSVGYNVFPWENTTIGVVATRDTAYSDQYVTNDGSLGDGDNFYTYSLRVGVKF
jgi:hypothetical protein